MGTEKTQESAPPASRCYASGPWKANIFSEKTMDIVSNDGQVVVHWSGFDSSSRTPEQNKANATLIAAAPELLEACKLLLRLSLPMDVSGMAMIEEARSVVRKVEGA